PPLQFSSLHATILYMPIKVLSETVAARIAAGEVVERPASVVKELVENSLDAGATRVEIDIVDGGQKRIRIQDNGCGIPREEATLAFKRHATSKLETATDLERIATLGFRGEALASIASVSRVTCTTRHVDEKVGTRLRLEGGKLVSNTAIGRPPGTEMVIEDLFYNVPARRKFLRTERTERRHIDAFLTRYAIAYPEIAFRVTQNGHEVLATSGSGDPQAALIAVYGMDLGGSLLEIAPETTAEQPIQVRGFVGPTTVHRANRGYITLFINGRWVEDLRLTYAVIQAYHTLLPTKRYPVAFVEVTMPPGEVDVNVHPAKTEVRFRDGDAAFRAVQRAVRATVIEQAPAAAAWEPGAEHAEQAEDASQPQGNAALRSKLSQLQPQGRQIEFDTARPARQAAGAAAADQPGAAQAEGERPALSGSTSSLPPLRVIGQAASMFIIAEGPDGLYLIDQHAAHERILYEQMTARWATGDVPAQPLLEPQSVTLAPDESDQLEALLPTLHALGIEVEAFGPNTFLVRALPAPLPDLDANKLLIDLAGSIEAGAEAPSPIRTALEEQVVRHICKRAAVKAGQVLSTEEMKRLIHDLERTENPRTCPHGRPTILQISTTQLARQFGRTE
ncbi:MAG: DNA mismatch repair endonuclease MutL, partial [Anaerolineales bacterium]